MRNSQMYTLIFAAVVCVLSSLLISSAAVGFRDRQEANIVLDKRYNLLLAIGSDVKANDRERIEQEYKDNMEGLALNLDGEIIEGLTPDMIFKEPAKYKDALPMFKIKKEGYVDGYVIPVSGYGLWSTLYGYLALEKDANTIRGITFYDHKETPGLGAEISSAWFQEQFKGKKVLDEGGSLISIKVLKAGNKAQGDHEVEGISGATITSRGVMNLLKTGMEKYESYFKKVRADNQ